MHSVRTTIQHWYAWQSLIWDRQLRDLITFSGQNRHDLLAVHQSTVQLHNTKTRQSTAVLRDLPFSPTSMAAAHGYVAVGGQRSQIVVRSLVNPQW